MYDVVVVGIGGMGSAAAAHCATRGARVLGIEQHARGNSLSASTGKTRVIRRAYFEDEAYVPLIDRAYELWRELEQATGDHILFTDGMLTAGYHGSEIVEGAMKAVDLHGLNAQFWEATDIRAHYPAVRVNDDDYGVFEPEGGFVVPELSVEAHCKVAEQHGAELRFETGFTRWEEYGDSLRVNLSDGDCIRTQKLILTLGPWFTKTMASLGVPMRVQRNVAAWFKPDHALGPRDLPTFLVHRREDPAPFYGFPDVGDGVKGAFHGLGIYTDADSLNREIDRASDIEPIADAFNAWVPGAAHQFSDAKACMYSLTPDEHFVVDLHPKNRRIVVCGGFSGHGFKFAPVVGEIAADLALTGGTGHDIEFLSVVSRRRFMPVTTLDPKTALVVIDMQRGIVGRETAPYSAKDVLARVVELVDAFRVHKRPVVLVNVGFAADRADALQPRVDAPTPMGSLPPDFSVLVDELRADRDGDILVTKKQWGAFYGTDLDLQLRRRHVTGIVLCGIATSIGVESTARSAFEHGYNQTFASDAMTDLTKEAHENSLTRIFPRIGEIDTTAAIISKLG